MGWKQAVLSAGVSSAASKKRNIELLKDLTIEERRQLILDSARKSLESTPQKISLRQSKAMGASRSNLHSHKAKNEQIEKEDLAYIPLEVDKKSASIRGSFFIPTQNSDGEYQNSAIISGYVKFTGLTGSVPSPAKEDLNILKRGVFSAPDGLTPMELRKSSLNETTPKSSQNSPEIPISSPTTNVNSSDINSKNCAQFQGAHSGYLPNPGPARTEEEVDASVADIKPSGGYEAQPEQEEFVRRAKVDWSPGELNTPFGTTEYKSTQNSYEKLRSSGSLDSIANLDSTEHTETFVPQPANKRKTTLEEILGKAPTPIPRRLANTIEDASHHFSQPRLDHSASGSGSTTSNRPKSLSYNNILRPQKNSRRSEWCMNKPLQHFDSIKFDDLGSSDEESVDGVFAPSTSEGTTGTWTERFQTTIDNLRSFNANTPLDQLIDGNADLLYLAQDFLHCAETYGRIIIAERFLSVENKTIKPISLGGVSGGEKYIVHETLFKFAVDSYGILGSDYAAAKVAGNELKGLICYFNSQITELRVPLMALVDYMGFRIIAMSLLPINKDTLVYGTNDGGIVIHNSNMKLYSLMKEAAEAINIKKHICGLRAMSGLRLRGWKELYSPADLEGHLGEDGNFYLIDFARTLPPESPDLRSKSSHLYRLLRPEFIKAYEEPLCSDGFSGFLMADPNIEEHNQALRDATTYLKTDLIPRFVRDSLVWQVREAVERNALHEFRLTEAIHAKGICMRHIGYILKHIRSESEFACVRALLLVEAIARVIKNKLRGLLRRKMKNVRQPLEAPYRQLVVRFLNLVFGKSRESVEFWKIVIKKQLASKFNIDGQTTSEGFPLKKFLGLMATNELSPLLMLFGRLVSLTGIKLTPQASTKVNDPTKFARITKERYPFDDTDLDEIGYRVKHMNIISEALGSYYYYKGLRQSLEGSTECDSPVELLRTALDKYEEALMSNPTNVGLLKNSALCCTRIVELVASGGCHLEDIQFDPSAADIQKADQYYIRAVASDPDDGETLYSYAKFLWKCGRFERAEEYFLQSLETNPNFVWCLRDYGVLLSEQGLEELAEEFFVLASKKTNVLSNTPRANRNLR